MANERGSNLHSKRCERSNRENPYFFEQENKKANDEGKEADHKNAGWSHFPSNADDADGKNDKKQQQTY